MNFRSTLLGVLLATVAVTGSAQARDTTLPGVLSQHARPGNIILAQMADPRVTSLEEQVRQLNGTIEELNFQILQMQEQLRKIQEDNEFRFQELEQRKSDAGTGGSTNTAKVERPRPADQAMAPAAAPEGDVAQASPSGPAPAGTGEPPRTFGTITFDANGNPIGGTVDPLPPPRDRSAVEADNTTVAALPATDSSDELYRNSYEFVLSGDYKTAEAGFRDHIKRFPDDPKASDAHFWLGESLLAQSRYRDAAEVFLDANRSFPDAKKAPDMLLKLGVSLAALSQREVACATYKEIGQRYPQATAALQERVRQEQALAGC